jgi:hypothetical protein
LVIIFTATLQTTHESKNVYNKPSSNLPTNDNIKLESLATQQIDMEVPPIQQWVIFRNPAYQITLVQKNNHDTLIESNETKLVNLKIINDNRIVLSTTSIDRSLIRLAYDFNIIIQTADRNVSASADPLLALENSEHNILTLRLYQDTIGISITNIEDTELPTFEKKTN